MPGTTAETGPMSESVTGSAARFPAGRSATVLVATACYAGLLAVVVGPMLARSGPAPVVPTSIARAKAAPLRAAEPVRVAEAGLETPPAARGFPVPVDDPLLVNEQIYQLLASQAPPALASQAPPAPEPVVAKAAEAAPEPAREIAAREAPSPPPRPADVPTVPVQQAAVGVPEPRSDAFVGVWGSNRAACTADGNRKGYLLTAIDEAGAWAGETRCSFRDKRRTAEGWSMKARCTSSRERWTADVRLRMDGARLHWASQRGTQTYVRCERRLLTAQAS